MAGLDTLPMPSTSAELVAVLAFIAANVFAVYWQGRKAKSERAEAHSELSDTLERVRHQIENSHTTNFRDEFDGVIADVRYLRTKIDTNHVEDMKFRADVYTDLQRLNSVAIKNHPKDMK